VTTLWSEAVDLWEQILLSKRRCDLIIRGNASGLKCIANPLRWYFYHEFLMMLERAGFEDLVTYSDHSDRPATQESKTVVYGALRPRSAAIGFPI